MKKLFKILVIEDSEEDFLLLKKAMEYIEDIELEIVCMKNGQLGLDYIFKVGEYSEMKTPDVIILDLNLPVKNGFEVLKTIKEDSLYRLIPIIIYSTSDESGDICASYFLYANSYLTKTFDIIELFEKIKCFGEYWAKSVEIADNNNHCLINEGKK